MAHEIPIAEKEKYKYRHQHENENEVPWFKQTLHLDSKI